MTRYVLGRQAAGAANATINRELSALRRMLRLAERAGRLDRIPYIPMLREDNVRTGFFEREQFEAVRRRLPDYLQPPITVAHITGWRVTSELLTRRWAHVDFVGGWLRLEPGETKNGEGRQFPLIPELRAVLERQRSATELLQRGSRQIIPWVFHRDGEPIKDFRAAWKTACRAAGVPGRIPHDFRRTAVRNLERAGVPRSVAMKLVGHKTEAIYRRYAIVAESDLRAGGDKLAAVQL
jgi:integrase